MGEPSAQVRRAAVCHDVTESVVERCLGEDVDLLVTYHPLLFRPIRRLVAGATPGGRALRLAAAGVAVAAVHTAWDAARGGTADSLAEALGVAEVTGFGALWGPESTKVVTFVPDHEGEVVADAMAAAGGGRIGNYSGCFFRAAGTGIFTPLPGADPHAGAVGERSAESEIRIEMNVPAARLDAVVAALVAVHPYENPAYDIYQRRGDAGFVGRVGTVASTDLRSLAGVVGDVLGGTLRVAGPPQKSIERVAVIPGSGSEFIDDALAARADAIITGDVSHHRAMDTVDAGMAVLDPGHQATEQPGVRALYAAVADIVDTPLDFTNDGGPYWETSWKS